MNRTQVLQLLAESKPTLVARFGLVSLALFGSAARDAAGHTVEAHQTYFREAVDPNSDTVFSLHFTMDDGTVLTGQVEVISPALAA